MRENKYRVWNIQKKRFTLQECGLLRDGSLIFNNDDIWTVGDPSRFIVMQYQGLSDKNGVEIYEGDLTKGIYFPLGVNRSAVEFFTIYEAIEHRGFRCKMSGVNILDKSRAPSYLKQELKRHRHATAGYDWVDSGQYMVAHQSLVIGNIYENPELINPEQVKA